MTSEPNEQFHYSRSLETTLVRYFSGTYLSFHGGVTGESACESAYLESLTNLHDLMANLQPDPRKSDQIMRAVMPPRFEETDDSDVGLWLIKLRLVPVMLMKRGDISIASEEVNMMFFEELVRWTVGAGEGHSVQCATTGGCQHELTSHQELCPVRTTAITLSDEIRLLYFVLHGNYTEYSLADKLHFTQNRIKALGELLVRYGVTSRDTAQTFLDEAENEAIIYGSQVNGLSSFPDSQGE